MRLSIGGDEANRPILDRDAQPRRRLLNGEPSIATTAHPAPLSQVLRRAEPRKPMAQRGMAAVAWSPLCSNLDCRGIAAREDQTEKNGEGHTS